MFFHCFVFLALAAPTRSGRTVSPRIRGSFSSLPDARTKRKKLDEERKRLETDLVSEEEKLVELHKDHVDVVEVQLQGKKKQKLEFEQKLHRKMHAIQRMQQEYA